MNETFTQTDTLLNDSVFRAKALEKTASGEVAWSINQLYALYGGGKVYTLSNIVNAVKEIREPNTQIVKSPPVAKITHIQKALAPIPPIGSLNKKDFRQEVIKAGLQPPIGWKQSPENVEELKNEIALLKQQVSWAQKANPTQRTGGKIHLVISDLHLCGRDHMPACFKQMREKFSILAGQYKPDEIVVILNGDAVAGSGIYRNQHKDTILQSITDQVRMAAYKIYEFDQEIRQAAPQSHVSWKIILGNHDVAMGENIAPYFSHLARNFGVDATYVGDSLIVNLADNGSYNVYIEHGYGYNKYAPSGTSWLADLKGKLYERSGKYEGENRLRRAVHGHTHWLNIGMEHMSDFYVDTLGGLQRNERGQLGKSSRPMGFIAYVSPNDYSGILEPIAVRPEIELVESEWEDQGLNYNNFQDCSQTLTKCDALALATKTQSLQGWEGR